MEVEPPYKLLKMFALFSLHTLFKLPTLLTLFTLFTLFTVFTVFTLFLGINVKFKFLTPPRVKKTGRNEKSIIQSV